MAINELPGYPGGGFNPPEPTAKGGPDYGRFIAAVRALQDHSRAVDAPDEVIGEAAELVEKVSSLLAPFDTDEWSSLSGRRMDLPNRGGILPVPAQLARDDDGRVRGWARFGRYHLGPNGAAHGGAISLLFDSALGLTSPVVTNIRNQRTAYLHVNFRAIVPIEKMLRVDTGVSRIEGRKIFVEAKLFDGQKLLTEAEALFLLLKPGQQ